MAFLPKKQIFTSCSRVFKSTMATERLFSTIPKSAFLPEPLVVERVLYAAQKIKSTPISLNAKSHLIFDLGFDSLNRKEFVENVSAEFCVSVPDNVADSIVTIQDAVYYIATHPKAR